MRVLYVESNEDHTVGGSHRALFDLVTRLDRTHYEPHVLFNQENVYASRLRDAGVPVHIFAPEREKERAIRSTRGPLVRKLDIPAAVWRRYRLLRRLGIGMLHLNNSPAIGSDDWLPAAKLMRIPAIAFAMTNATAPTAVHRHLIRGFDRILPCSDYMCGQVLEMGAAPAQIERVYLGVDIPSLTARLTRSRNEMRKELGVPEGQVLAAMVGNVRPWKGQHVLLEALRQLLGQGLPIPQVVIAGATAPEDASYEADLRRTIRTEGLEAHVQLLGHREDIPDIFNAADLAIHASTRAEPFGLVIVEAMALGAVVIASEEGGAGEIVDSATGMTFDPRSPEMLAERLRTLLETAERREDLRRRGRERATAFSIEAFTSNVERIYAQVLRNEDTALRKAS